MSVIKLNDVHNNLIKSIAQKEEISSYDLTFQPGSIKGDNYLGVITNIIIKDRQSSKSLDLILKTATSNEETRKQVPIHLAYIREVFIYEELFKVYEDFQNEFCIKRPFKAHTKCYGSYLEKPNECLVFQNMKAIGYKMWSRREPMNSEHIGMVFAEYGKLHGLSFALKHHKPGVFEKISKNMNNDYMEEFSDEVIENLYGTLFKKLINDFKDDKKIQDILQNYYNKEAIDFPKEFWKVKDFAVFVHGDCWNNNMLFKYDNEINQTKPNEICLLDWQISHYGSPINDLAYFFFVCSPKEILYDYKTYLKIYYDSLSCILKEFGCNPEAFITYEQFDDQWSKYCKIGLYMAMNILKLMLSDNDEAFTIDEISDSGKDIVDVFSFNSKNDHIYRSRIADIVLFLYEHGFLMSK